MVIRFFILFIFLSCSMLHAQDLDIKEVSKHWILTKIKTQDNKEFQPSIDDEPYKELILLSTGSFIQPYNDQYSAGTWIIKDNYLGLKITEINGKTWNSEDYSYNWKIISVKSTELILRIGGDHGFYYYIYNPKN